VVKLLKESQLRKHRFCSWHLNQLEGDGEVRFLKMEWKGCCCCPPASSRGPGPSVPVLGVRQGVLAGTLMPLEGKPRLKIDLNFEH